MLAFLKTYRFNVSDEHTGDPIRQKVYDFDFKDADFYSALYGDVGNWPPAVLRGIVDRFAETGTHGLEFKSEYSLPTGYHEKLFDALKSYFKCAGEDYTTIDETIYMEYGGGADVDGYSLKFSPEALVSAVESGSRSLEGELVNAFDNWTSIDLDLFAMYISEHADEIVTSCSTSETDLDDALKRNKQFAKKHKKTRKKTNDRDEPESDSDSSEQDDTQVDSYAVPYGAY